MEFPRYLRCNGAAAALAHLFHAQKFMPLNVQVYVFAGCIRTGEDGKIIKVGVGICNLHVNLHGGWGRSICNKNAYSHIVSPINISNGDLLAGLWRCGVLVIEKCY